MSRWRIFLTTLLAALLSVAGGTLECGLPKIAASQHRGRQVYATMCAVCHGANGQGYAADHAPALASSDFLASVTDEALRAAITNGRAGTTMSAWGVSRGGPLHAPDVDALIAMLRSWETPPPVSLDESPLAGDAGRGGVLYARECVHCHGVNGRGGEFETLGTEFLTTSTNGFLRHAIRRGRSGTAMPSFSAPLGPGAIDDVIAFVRSWPAVAPPPRTTPAKMPPIPLGPVPLHPKGPDPEGFRMQPLTTKADVIRAQLDRGARMAILDARAPSDYAENHITGAVSVPFYDPTPYFDGLPRDTWLVCYCACPHAESGQLARKLVEKGFTKVTVLDEGLPYWASKKYGTQSGIE